MSTLSGEGEGLPQAVRVSRLRRIAQAVLHAAHPLRGNATNLRLVESFAYSGAIQVVNVFTGIVLARALGVGARGQLAAAILWPSIVASLGNFGMSDATTYFAAQRSFPKRTLVGSTAAIWVVQSAILCGIGLLIVPRVLGHYGSATVAASRLYTANIPGYLAVGYTTSLLQGWKRLSVFQGIRFLVVFLAAAGLGLALVAGDLSVRTGVVVYLGVYTVCALIGIAAVAWRLGGKPDVSVSVVRRLMWYGVRSHTDSVASIFNQRLDQLLISVFLAPVQLGLYVVAVTLSSLTNLIGSSVSLVAMPAVSAEEAGERRAAIATRFVRVTLIATAAITVPMLAFAPQLMRLFFGASYARASDVARVLLGAAILFNTGRVISTTLKGIGRPLDAGIAEVVALAATGASLAVLLPLFGLMGAAVASLLAYGVSAGWMTRRASRALDTHWSSLLFGTSIRVIGHARA